MKTHKIISLLAGVLSLLMFVACQSPQKTSSSTLIPMKERNLSADFTNLQLYDSILIDDIFNLWAWKILDSKVCFETLDGNGNENILYVYSYPDGEKMQQLGKRGQGPDEYIAVNPGDALGDDVMMYDIMASKLRLYTWTSDTLHIAKTLSLYADEEGVCKPFTGISQITDSTFLMQISDARYSAWEIADLRTGEVLSSFKNPCRWGEEEGIPYTPFSFMQCTTDTLMVAAYEYMDRVEYYSTAHNRITPLFAMGSSEDQAEMENYNYLKKYYVGVTTDSRYFYCLKSDAGLKQGNIVEVYDREGNLKAHYALEVPVTSLKIDKSGFMVGYVEGADQTVLYRFKAIGL